MRARRSGSLDPDPIDRADLDHRDEFVEQPDTQIEAPSELKAELDPALAASMDLEIDASMDASMDREMDTAAARGAIDLPLGEPDELLSASENGADASRPLDGLGDSTSYDSTSDEGAPTRADVVDDSSALAEVSTAVDNEFPGDRPVRPEAEEPTSFDLPSIDAKVKPELAATGEPIVSAAIATDADHVAADETLDSTALVDSVVRHRPTLDIDLGEQPAAAPPPPGSTRPSVPEAPREPLPRARSLTSFVAGGRPIPQPPLGPDDLLGRIPDEVEAAIAATSGSAIPTAESTPGQLSDVIYRDLAVAASQTVITVEDVESEPDGAGYPIPVSEDWPVSMARRRGGLLGRVYTRLVSFLRRVPRLLGLKRRGDND